MGRVREGDPVKQAQAFAEWKAEVHKAVLAALPDFDLDELDDDDLRDARNSGYTLQETVDLIIASEESDG